MNRFDVATLAVVPWKNGGGRTREIIRVPADATLDTVDWRVSIAELSASGPFSTFASVDRIITLLDGAGIHMRSHDGVVDHRLHAPLEPFAFRGECEIDATLLGGPSTDFNVMTRRATTRAELSIVRAPTTLPETRAGVLYAAHGQWRIDDHSGASYALAGGSGVSWNDELFAWTAAPLAPDAALIAVYIRRA